MNIRNNKGIALVITLLVLTLLIVLILEFSQGMRVEARAAANFRDEIKAYYLARSGVTFAIAVLEDDKNNQETKNVDSLNESWAQKLPPIPLGDGFVSVEIVDESSKINVNKLKDKSDDKWHELMGKFLEHLELKEDIAETISDWIDPNPEERSGGAESSYYESLEEPYEAKNNFLDSLQELRLIKDIDNDTLEKMKNFLTIVPSDGRININTAGKNVLTSLFALSEMLSDTGTVDEVINSRTENPFVNENELASGTNGRHLISDEALGDIRNYITIKSDFFSITSTGDVNQVMKKITAIVQRESNKTKIIYWRVE